jgi:hypothetical protein
MMQAARENDRVTLQELHTRLAVIENAREDDKPRLMRIEQSLVEVRSILSKLEGATDYKNKLLKGITWGLGVLATSDLFIHIFKWFIGA